MSWRDDLRKLVSDPKTGELSTSEVMVVGAFLVTSLVVLHTTWTHTLSEYVYIGYLAVWATHSQASRLMALQRDRMEKSDDDAR